jgi:hypothetical protein
VAGATRTLDRAGRVVGELVVDALFIVRRHPWHWPAVAIGAAAALVGSSAAGAPWILAVPIGFIGGGFGMNVGSDFRFVVRTPTRLLLLGSSRVIASPTEVLATIDPSTVRISGRGVARMVALAGEQHVMAAVHTGRLARMLPLPPGT